jgi:hypothetical protein
MPVRYGCERALKPQRLSPRLSRWQKAGSGGQSDRNGDGVRIWAIDFFRVVAADDAWAFQPQPNFQPQHILPKQFSLIALLFKTFAVRHRVAPLDSSNNRVEQTKVPAYDSGKTQLR